MFSSYRRAGTGIVFCECRDEGALISGVRAESNGRQLAVHYAPTGATIPVDERGMLAGETLAASGNGALYRALQWAADKVGDRILIILDAGPVLGNAGIYRQMLDALPRLRTPASGKPSLVILAAPQWQLGPDNPMRGLLPVLSQAHPTRDALASALGKITGAPALPADGSVLDALSGLSAAVAEQTAAESLIACGMRWDASHLASARRAALRDGGLEIRPAVHAMGGLAPYRAWIDAEVRPWTRDRQLAVRRILCAGVPGVGKSYGAQYLAGVLGCECARISIPRLKAGIVGASESNLRRALQTVDALAADAPLIVLLDEIDKLATEGLDGGTSSGMYAELLAWMDGQTSLALIVATLNRVDRIDAALDSRFASRWFFDLPSPQEREEIAAIHLAALGAADPRGTAHQIAEVSEGMSARELATELCPSILRRSDRRPDADAVISCARAIVPTATTQAKQLAEMRTAATGMRRASSRGPEDVRQGRSMS